MRENNSSAEAGDLTAPCRIPDILKGTETTYHCFYHYWILKFDHAVVDTKEGRNMLEGEE